MRHIFSLILILALISSGCASKPAIYGNHSVDSTRINLSQIANMATQAVVTLYPPATIRLELQYPTHDGFGAALVKGLRTNGYALLESNERTDKTTGEARSLPLRYTLDSIGNSNLFYLRLWIGTESLSRIYQNNRDYASPIGAWVHKKSPEKSLSIEGAIPVDIDVRTILSEIAEDMKLRFRVEGDQHAIIVTKPASHIPNVKKLRVIGDQIGERVWVIQRHDEIVLRYPPAINQ